MNINLFRKFIYLIFKYLLSREYYIYIYIYISLHEGIGNQQIVQFYVLILWKNYLILILVYEKLASHVLVWLNHFESYLTNVIKICYILNFIIKYKFTLKNAVGPAGKFVTNKLNI